MNKKLEIENLSDIIKEFQKNVQEIHNYWIKISKIYVKFIKIKQQKKNTNLTKMYMVKNRMISMINNKIIIITWQLKTSL